MVLTSIKYSEDYIVIPGTSIIIANPFEYWTEKHKFASQAVDYVECVNLSMQTGVLILLPCFWNYLSNIVTKRSFMSSLEFKFYIAWAIASMIAFPVLQYNFRKSELLRETVLLLAYSVEEFIISCLGIRSNKRFNRTLKVFRNLGRSDGSDLPIRTSSRGNANISVNNGLASLNPPQRPKPKQSSSPDSLRKVNLPEIEDSFNRGSVSTVSAYGSYSHKSTQNNSTQSVENNQHEDTPKNNEESTNNEIYFDQSWLRRSPTKK
ncbi:hypothetical protein INT48_007870 [Thamnidium elegans]|uniref:Uncharacterized protein n=1 Tax=Thamnidium elegans TaxID=101142 RepID=A0A8H7SUH4_9FUNG|nr:hypothetical protein INT48_007870 [Thamnidium elegans]